MKSSNGFDARRLRPRGRSHWGLRLCTLIAALLAALGTLLALAGLARLAGHPLQATGLDLSNSGALILSACGVLALYLGVALWRRCHRSMRRSSALNMAPHLLKKHD